MSTPPPGRLASPSGIAVDADGNVWVVETGANRVVKYDFNGTFIAAVDTPVVTQPEDIAADQDGFLYVADAGRVVKIDTGGRHVRNFRTAGISPGIVAVDGAGVIYAGGGSGDPIERYSPTGRRLAPIRDTRSAQVNGIAVGAGQVYVSRAGDSTISRYSAGSNRGTPYLKR